MASSSSLVVRSRGWRTSVRSSVARSGLCGGSRMIRGRDMSCTVARGTTTSSVSVRFYRFSFYISFSFSFGSFLMLMRYLLLTGKETPTHRLTHILRPNATRLDPSVRAALATPPTTDGDLSSYDSDVPSLLSDVQSTDGRSDVLLESESTPDLEHDHHRLGHVREEGTPLSDIASDVDADVETGSTQGDGASGGGDSDLEQAT